MHSTRTVACPRCEQACYIGTWYPLTYLTHGVEQEWSDGYTTSQPAVTLVGRCPECLNPFWFDEARSPRSPSPADPDGVQPLPIDVLWSMLLESAGDQGSKERFRHQHLAREVLWFENHPFRRRLVPGFDLDRTLTTCNIQRRGEALRVLHRSWSARQGRSEREDLLYAEYLREAEEWDLARAVLLRDFQRPVEVAYALQLRVLVDCKLAYPARLRAPSRSSGEHPCLPSS